MPRLNPHCGTMLSSALTILSAAQACGLISKDTMQSIRPHALLLRCRSSLHQALCGNPCQIRSAHDPAAAGAGRQHAGSASHCDEYRGGRSIRNGCDPRAASTSANVVLEKSNANSAVLLTVLAGPAHARRRNAAAHRAGRAACPRALQINKAIDSRQSEAATFADYAGWPQRCDFPRWMPVAELVHANAAGDEMLRADDVLAPIGGHLVVRNAQVNRTLHELLANHADVTNAKGSALALTRA